MVLSGSLHRKVRRIAAKLRNEQLREDLWTFQDHFQDHLTLKSIPATCANALPHLCSLALLARCLESDFRGEGFGL